MMPGERQFDESAVQLSAEDESHRVFRRWSRWELTQGFTARHLARNIGRRSRADRKANAEAVAFRVQQQPCASVKAENPHSAIAVADDVAARGRSWP